MTMGSPCSALCGVGAAVAVADRRVSVKRRGIVESIVGGCCRIETGDSRE
jgi:hypothetical protein